MAMWGNIAEICCRNIALSSFHMNTENRSSTGTRQGLGFPNNRLGWHFLEKTGQVSYLNRWKAEWRPGGGKCDQQGSN